MPAKKFETNEPYLRGLHAFLENYRVETLDTEIRNNIQQLYLLQVHNYYKNRFYLQLVSVLKWSVYVTLVVAIAVGVLVSVCV